MHGNSETRHFSDFQNIDCRCYSDFIAAPCLSLPRAKQDEVNELVGNEGKDQRETEYQMAMNALSAT